MLSTRLGGSLQSTENYVISANRLFFPPFFFFGFWGFHHKLLKCLIQEDQIDFLGITSDCFDVIKIPLKQQQKVGFLFIYFGLLTGHKIGGFA